MCWTAYDAFGFAVRKKFRGATDAVTLAPDQQMSVIRCLPSNCWRPVEQYQVTTVQDGSPTRIERNDALGRTSVAAEKMLDGDWSHVVSEYNGKGQLVWRTEPLISYQPNWVWTTYFYDDILGRMTKKIVPKQGEDGRGDMVTDYVYAGRTTNIQVCGSADSGTGNCLNLSRTTDSLGRYVETRDALNGRTRFWYEANGNVAAIEDANGIVTKAAYNSIGQRTGVNDPNQGAWSFVYNALGEVTSQTDARGIATHLGYDKLGRPYWRTATVDATGDGAADLVEDSWTYDPANAKGAPATSQRQINSLHERWTGTTYDALARPVRSDVVQAMTSGTQQYTQRTKYDSYYGRPVGQEFPNGEAVQVLYSIYGHGMAEKEPISGVEYRRTNTVNGRGQATQETFGNGVVLTPTYQLQTGQLTGLTYSNGGGTLRQLGYGYDVFGNLKRQSLGGGASREDYSYDQLHRLVQSIRSGAASGTVHYGFDAVGNLTKKSDFSANTSNAYSYTGATCGGGANAVKSVQLAAGGSRTYCYDANGNLTSDNAGLSLKYDHQNLPIVAQRGALRDDFRYGPDGMRTRSWGSDGARVYLPGYEHRTDTGETKVYIGDYAVISRTGSTRKVEYLLKDRLGSVDAVANSSGVVTETRGYDAFGKPRSGTWNDLSPAKIASTAVTPKGFTQHEHLNELELIHMNGRMYDYNVGRFMGVDPFIQFPLNSQSLNPYSYILNNPLSGTDPTGYLACIGQNLCVEGAGGKPFGGAGNQPCSKAECRFALGGSGAKNGAKGGSGATSEKRDESKGGASGKLSEIGGAVKRGLFGPIIEYGERGEPGDTGDHLRNIGKWGANTAVDLFATTPLGQVLERSGNLPRLEYGSKGLVSAAFLQTVSLTGGALKGGVSAAGKVGKIGKAGKVVGEVAEGGAPSMRQPAAARGTQEAVAEVKDVPQQMYGPYYRYGDSPENVNKIIESGELLGNQGRNTHAGSDPAVRAYRDDWQEGLPTIEFTTPVAPYRYSTPSKPVWNSETPGVIVRGDQVAIPCLVTCTRP